MKVDSREYSTPSTAVALGHFDTEVMQSNVNSKDWRTN